MRSRRIAVAAVAEDVVVSRNSRATPPRQGRTHADSRRHVPPLCRRTPIIAVSGWDRIVFRPRDRRFSLSVDSASGRCGPWNFAGPKSREMALGGDYFRPTINGHLYYDKPLGSYWLVLAASALTGTLDEATARLPSTVAGWLGVVLIIDIGRRLYDRRTGLVAGLVLATSFGFVGFCATASADAETAAGTLAALALFLRREDRLRGWWVVALWAIMAVTSLTKGLLGFALPMVVLFADAALAGFAPLRDRLRWLIGRRSIVAAGLGWPFTSRRSRSPAAAGQGLFMVFRENVRRFFDPVNHRGPAYLYLYVIVGLFARGRCSCRRRRAAREHVAPGLARGDRFAIAYFGATFLFFTLAGSRRSYYLLPVLPAAAFSSPDC